MQKLKFFIFVILITPLICGVFGILHDQITFTISPEYFTKFKFVQFRLYDEYLNLRMNNRVAAGIVGFKATWWVGIPIGLLYGFLLVILKEQQNLYRLFAKTMGITLNITILFGLIGYGRGILAIKNHEIPNWYFPADLVDIKRFVVVGNIHNMSYIGSTVGLMAGVLFLSIKKTKEKRMRRTINIRKPEF